MYGNRGGRGGGRGRGRGGGGNDDDGTQPTPSQKKFTGKCDLCKLKGHKVLECPKFLAIMAHADAVCPDGGDSADSVSTAELPLRSTNVEVNTEQDGGDDAESVQ